MVEILELTKLTGILVAKKYPSRIIPLNVKI